MLHNVILVKLLILPLTEMVDIKNPKVIYIFYKQVCWNIINILEACCPQILLLIFYKLWIYAFCCTTKLVKKKLLVLKRFLVISQVIFFRYAIII